MIDNKPTKGSRRFSVGLILLIIGVITFYLSLRYVLINVLYGLPIIFYLIGATLIFFSNRTIIVKILCSLILVLLYMLYLLFWTCKNTYSF